MNVIDRIDKLLKDSNVPKSKIRGELARVCGVTPQAVAGWYSGATKKISPEHIAAVAAEWNESTDYLITGKRRKNESAPSTASQTSLPDDKERPETTPTIDPEKLWEMYQSLPEDARKMVYQNMLTLKSLGSTNKK